MSKPIRMTKEIVQQMVQEFQDALSKMTLADGKVRYERTVVCEDDDDLPKKVNVVFSPMAFLKMRTLIDSYEGEVAWHGVTERVDVDTFKVTDILVYPQNVSQAYVDFDTERYAKWLYDNRDDPRFDNIHFQAHSHVNFDASPSERDLESNKNWIPSEDNYYIIMIWNKKPNYTVKVYDGVTNTLYEGSEVRVSIEGFDKEAFLKEAREIAVPMQHATAPTEKKSKKKDKETSWPTYGYGYGYGSDYSYGSGCTVGGYHLDRNTGKWVQTSLDD